MMLNDETETYHDCLFMVHASKRNFSSSITRRVQLLGYLYMHEVYQLTAFGYGKTLNPYSKDVTIAQFSARSERNCQPFGHFPRS